MGVLPARRTRSATLPGGNRIERQLVKMMLQFPEILPEIRKQGVVPLIDDPHLKAIGQDILNDEESIDPSVDNPAGEADEVKRRLIAQLSIQEEIWDYKGCQRFINQFLLSKKRREAGTLDAQIKKAENEQDEQRWLELLRARQQQAVQADQRKTGFQKGVE